MLRGAGEPPVAVAGAAMDNGAVTGSTRAAAALVATVLLGGCGAADPSTDLPSSTSPPSPTGSPMSPSPRDSEQPAPSDSPTEDLVLPTTSSRGAVTVIGVVTVDDELRCTTLTPDGGSGVFVLVGDLPAVRTGDRLRVTGVRDPEAATTCQAGPVLVVREARVEG